MQCSKKVHQTANGLKMNEQKIYLPSEQMRTWSLKFKDLGQTKKYVCFGYMLLKIRVGRSDYFLYILQ